MNIPSKHYPKIVVSLLLGLSFVVGATFPPDKLSDFKDAEQAAKSGKGCESIPYSEQRSACASQGSEVHDWCDGKRGPVTCENERITRDLKDRVEREKANIVSLKEKKSKLEDQRSRASDQNEKDRLSKDIEKVDNEIYNGGKTVDSAIADFDRRKKLVDDAIYTIDRCLTYRQAVMNSFAEAQDRVRGETAADIVPIARYLRDYYEESKRGHAIAITDKKNALETCKNSRP